MLFKALHLLSLLYFVTLILRSQSQCPGTCTCATGSSVCNGCTYTSYFIKSDNSGCVAKCETEGAGTHYDPVTGKICRTNCYDQEGSYLNNAKLKCVSACEPDEALFTGIHWCAKCWKTTDVANLEIENCIRCASGVDKTMSYCTQCAPGTYLKQIGTCPHANCVTTCVDSCGAGFYINLAGTHCVTDCYSDNLGSLMPNDQVINKAIKCVSACDSNEYVNRYKKCSPCSDVSPRCIKCSNNTQCLQCISGFLLIENTCSTKLYDCTDVAYYYMNIAKTQCVHKCTEDDSAYLSSDETKCTSSCVTSGGGGAQLGSIGRECWRLGGSRPRLGRLLPFIRSLLPVDAGPYSLPNNPQSSNPIHSLFQRKKN